MMYLSMLRLSRQLALVIRHSLTTILSLTIFTGGIVILLSRIPGWSLFLGLLLIPLGLVLMVFSLDETARKVFVPENFRPARCSLCGKMTYAKEGEKEVVCGICQEKEVDELLKRNGKA